MAPKLPPPTSRPPKPTNERAKALITVGVFLLVLAAGGFGVMLGRDESPSAPVQTQTTTAPPTTRPPATSPTTRPPVQTAPPPPPPDDGGVDGDPSDGGGGGDPSDGGGGGDPSDGDGTSDDNTLPAIGAFTGVGSLALGIADYLRNNRRYSRERRREDAEWQARKVAGHIDWMPGRLGLNLIVTNASSLPVRNVRGYVYTKDHRQAYVGMFDHIPVVKPGTDDDTRSLPVNAPIRDRDFKLELVFDDEHGVTWRKYGDPPLQEERRHRTRHPHL